MSRFMLKERVQSLKGIGEKVEQQLNELNIYTIEDLLFYFPSRYNFFEQKPLHELTHGEKATIVGRVASEPVISYFGHRQSRLVFTLMVENIAVRAVIFNRAFLKKQITIGEMATLKGKWDAHRLQITVQTFESGEPEQTTEIEPSYPLKNVLTNYRFQQFIKTALESAYKTIKEILPVNYLTAYKLPARFSALKTMHFPESPFHLKHARRRFIYEEFLLFQLRMQLLRQSKRESDRGQAQHYEPLLIQQFIDELPFTLTEAQQKTLNEILADMKSPYRMNRLLQGDVGSGKTIVAAISLYASITANNQGALMVPTEILAEQHYESLKQLLGHKIKIALLTGSTKEKERREILQRVADQTIDLLIGTHALIQKDVEFAHLGFVVIDEQHRFGVEQRRTLRQKGFHPDTLFMTATPIPRTLAITAFGDMDISIINQLPAGRKQVQTYWVKENMFERVLNFINERVKEGEQAYIVCPLIEESDKLDIQNALDVYERLQQFYENDVNVGLLHGQLHAKEKEAMMQQFTSGEVDVLVSTTVIEVGVNVPQATVMVIYDAERFGLAQLHQLRGRVGRSDLQSYCILIADPKGDTGKERMRIMTSTNDGFELAEEDLKLRGPGDFFGHKQSGLPEFRVADMIRDYRALETARQDAIDIVTEDLLNRDPDYLPLKSLLDSDESLKQQLD